MRPDSLLRSDSSMLHAETNSDAGADAKRVQRDDAARLRDDNPGGGDERRGSGEHDADAAPIAIRELRKTFGKQTVLNGIDLTLAKGETLTVLGRSGTGKSVLLKLIIGLQQPDSGSICVHGQDIVGLATAQLNEIRKKIGFLFQSAALYDSLTVEENVAFPLKRHSKLSAADVKNRARELLASVGMKDDLQKLPSEISGGMQKRVGLARALALDPDIVLFDEPTAGLDPITASEIDALIVKLREERHVSSIVVTHDVHGARAISDRVALMRDGNILLTGTFAELEKSQDEFVQQFLNNGDANKNELNSGDLNRSGRTGSTALALR